MVLLAAAIRNSFDTVLPINLTRWSVDCMETKSSVSSCFRSAKMSCHSSPKLCKPLKVTAMPWAGFPSVFTTRLQPVNGLSLQLLTELARPVMQATCCCYAVSTGLRESDPCRSAIAPSQRCKTMLDALKAHLSALNYIAIGARVAEDLRLSQEFWQSQDFYAYRTTPGARHGVAPWCCAATNYQLDSSLQPAGLITEIHWALRQSPCCHQALSAGPQCDVRSGAAKSASPRCRRPVCSRTFGRVPSCVEHRV